MKGFCLKTNYLMYFKIKQSEDKGNAKANGKNKNKNKTKNRTNGKNITGSLYVPQHVLNILPNDRNSNHNKIESKINAKLPYKINRPHSSWITNQNKRYNKENNCDFTNQIYQNDTDQSFRQPILAQSKKWKRNVRSAYNGYMKENCNSLHVLTGEKIHLIEDKKYQKENIKAKRVNQRDEQVQLQDDINSTINDNSDEHINPSLQITEYIQRKNSIPKGLFFRNHNNLLKNPLNHFLKPSTNFYSSLYNNKSTITHTKHQSLMENEDNLNNNENITNQIKFQKPFTAKERKRDSFSGRRSFMNKYQTSANNKTEMFMKEKNNRLNLKSAGIRKFGNQNSILDMRKINSNFNFTSNTAFTQSIKNSNPNHNPTKQGRYARPQSNILTLNKFQECIQNDVQLFITHINYPNNLTNHVLKSKISR